MAPRYGSLGPISDWDVVEVAANLENVLDAVMQSQERLREAGAKQQPYNRVTVNHESSSKGFTSPEAIARSLELLDHVMFDTTFEHINEYSIPPNIDMPGYCPLSVTDTFSSEFLAQDLNIDSKQGERQRSTVHQEIMERAQLNACVLSKMPASTSGDENSIPSFKALLQEEEIDGNDDLPFDLDDEKKETATPPEESSEESSNLEARQKDDEASPSIFLTDKVEANSTGEVDELDAVLQQVPLASQVSSKPISRAGNLEISNGEGRASWAVTSALDERIFEAMRPKMALQFPFELDFFQKQAIMRLERHESVFVAAHTSAGKTVVAEYAIAMSQKHMSRTIYTSPIKALSNQKYRDFREKFGDDVGLITGDVSVNPEASCLIMTTEILRSMLYRGSDVVRDIEWVIFDEVHYVNDAERGVVWEEVIIMLPEHISLIFLSATTPNTIEFSDWIGRTKRRKVYVTSTLKRPVPLQHFLLHDDEYYRLMSPETGYNSSAVSAAAKAAKEKSKPKAMTGDNAAMKTQRDNEKLAALAAQQGKTIEAVKAAQAAQAAKSAQGKSALGGASGGSGGGSVRRTDMAGSKAQWLSLLRVLRGGGREAAGGLGTVDFGIGPARHQLDAHARKERATMDKWERLPEEFRRVVSKKEYERLQVRAEEEEGMAPMEGSLLPVVVFCFSKKKCEEIADHFSGQDLLIAKEKNHVRRAMLSVRQHLSTLDQRLPQLLRAEEMLLRGIGVHHGGLLPILKECTEILFSKGVVKVLVATETFAMGVNMPARSVVFNGFRKHDGRSMRDLLPGEYTQMAGRAGRRGLDKVGTVLVAAWTDLPAEVTVKQLLTGSATKLTSQFRLSYSMILNLLRVNDMSVEDMIKRSFSEFHTQRQLAGHDMQLRLKKAEALLSRLELEASNEDDEGILEQTIVETFQSRFAASQRALRNQMTYLASSSCKRSDLVASLCSGRVCWAHVALKHRATKMPSLSVILSDPDATAASASSAGTGLGVGLKIGGFGLGSSSSKDVGSGKEEEVWLLVWLPRAEAEELATMPSTSSSTNVTAAAVVTVATGWVETVRVAPNGDFGFWIVRAPISHLGSLLQEKLKMPLPGSCSSAPQTSLGSGSKGMSLGTGIGSRTTLSGVLGPDELLVVANMLHGVLQRPITKSTLSQLPSLSFADSTEVLSFSFTSALPLFDIPRELRIMSVDSVELQMKTASLQGYESLACMVLRMPTLQTKYQFAYKRSRLRARIAAYRHYASTANLALFPDYQQRLRILRMLEYVERDSDTVTLKGRVACEMNTCDELIASEMIFGNVLEPLTPPEAAAVLSAFVFQEKTEDIPRLTSRMEVAREQLEDILLVVKDLQDAEGVIVNEDFKPALNFGIAAVVYQWARGMPFKDITQMTTIHEGSIVRCITRLDELLKDVRNAARVIGNPSLYRKMVASSLCIKRDIVFAGSLYL